MAQSNIHTSVPESTQANPVELGINREQRTTKCLHLSQSEELHTHLLRTAGANQGKVPKIVFDSFLEHRKFMGAVEEYLKFLEPNWLKLVDYTKGGETNTNFLQVENQATTNQSSIEAMNPDAEFTSNASTSQEPEISLGNNLLSDATAEDPFDSSERPLELQFDQGPPASEVTRYLRDFHTKVKWSGQEGVVLTNEQNVSAALAKASEDQNIDVMNFLFKCVPPTFTIESRKFKSLLELALEAGLEDATRVLLSRGADPNRLFGTSIADNTPRNSASTSSRSPLHFAVSKGYLDIAKILLEGGADVDIGTFDSEYHDGEIHRYTETPLHVGVELENNSMVKLLLEHSANPDIQGPWKRTALHLAIQWTNSEMAELLLPHCSNPDIPDCDDWTPLRMAVEALGPKWNSYKVPLRKNSTEAPQVVAKIFGQLLDHGADPDKKLGNVSVRDAASNIEDQSIKNQVVVSLTTRRPGWREDAPGDLNDL